MAKNNATVKMYGPANSGSVSYDGETYEADKDGAMEVPAEAESALRDHGYTTDKPAAKSAK